MPYYEDYEKMFPELAEKLAIEMHFQTGDNWEAANVNPWHFNLVRDDGLKLSIRLEYGKAGKLTIYGVYPYKYKVYTDAPGNCIGSAITTAPATIAKGIINRLLSFVETHTALAEAYNDREIKADRLKDAMCDTFIIASGGKRARNNISSEKLYVVTDNTKGTGLMWEAKVMGGYSSSIRVKVEISNLDADEAIDVATLLRSLQIQRDVPEQEQRAREFA